MFTKRKQTLLTAAQAPLAALLLTAVVMGHSPAATAQDDSTAGKPIGSTIQKGPRALAREAAAELIRSRAPDLKIGKHDGFLARDVVTSGHLHYTPYERSYRGLPVVGGDFVVVTDDRGNVLSTSVAQTSKIRLGSTTPRVSKTRATSLARQQVTHVRKTTTQRLVVWQSRDSHLAWQVEVAGSDHGAPSLETVYVDAHTGQFLASKQGVRAGTGNTAHAGTVNFPTTKTASTYSLTYPGQTNLACKNYTSGTVYSGADDAWGNGSRHDLETACADAFYAVDQERQMLASWLGRDGMDGSGGWVPIKMGLDHEDAYYNGKAVTIGRLSDSGIWMSWIDVVAHEFGHGIDDHTPGGISDDTTAEFIADSFGSATEQFANNPVDTPDYVVGIEGDEPIRDSANPKSLGAPNCFDKNKIASTETHDAAGPGDHWFYLLAEGSNPTNGQPASPTCNGSKVTGVGAKTALQVLYNAMLMKTSSTSYPKYRLLTVTAAKNMDATCSLYNTVKAAWDAVSVPTQTGEPSCSTASPLSVTNPGARLGTAGSPVASFTLSASGGTTPYTWSATGLPRGLSIGSTTGAISGTPTTAGTFNVTATANGSGTSGSTSFTFTIGGDGTACSGQRLGNPGFESGSAAPWTADPGVLDDSDDQPARSGDWKAWLNGFGDTNTSEISQTVTIPRGCDATLSFYLHVGSEETSRSTAYDRLTVKIGSTTLDRFTNLDEESGYHRYDYDVSDYAGQTVKVTFSGKEDAELATSFVIDDTALRLG